MNRITIINGPNLNLLGRREPGIYGTTTADEIVERLRADFPQAEISYFQSNAEGDIIDRLQDEGFGPDRGFVINAGAYTHTSLAIADCIAAIPAPVVEVHISNVWAREQVRHHSMLSPVCRGVIAGLGTDVYRLAVEALLRM